ncbi:MAG: helix-turn-helix transcriptional regulator [Clostridia bacterium]|nr:helix-turn-helix transcriptional regulator [Clostridia bacterium]
MAKILRFNDDRNLIFNNKKSDEFPLLINTSGYYEAALPFETYNSIGRDDYYLMYITNGQLSFEIDDSLHIAKCGDFVIFPPNHKYKYEGAPPAYYLYVHFTGSYADRFLKECGFNNLPCIISNEFSVEMQNKFNKLIDTFLYNETLAIQRCASILQEIILDMARIELDKANNSPLKASLKYIHSFYTTKIDVPYLAKMENLSVSRYGTVFKRITGKSPNEYIIDLRLQLAKSLLENTKMSIRQISEKIGYTDQYFFSRLFKKYSGVSPQKYRKDNLL